MLQFIHQKSPIELESPILFDVSTLAEISN